MNFTIYSFGNGDVLFDVFTSIVLMTGAGYESLMRLGMVCLAFGGITYYLARGRVAMQLFMGAVLVLFTMVTIKATVQVTDLVNPGVPTRVVGNVPLAIAFPAYMASEVGYQLLTLAETAFATTVPPEYQMMNSTFARGFMDFQKTMGAQLPDSDLQANVTQYLMYCVFPSIGLNQLQKGTIFTAVDALAAIQVTNPVLSVMQVINGNPFTTLTCPDMYNNVIVPGMQDGNPDYDLAMRQLRRVLNQPDVVDQELTPVGQFLNNLINSAQGARQLINNVLIRERWVDAERLASAAGSDTATSVSLMQKQISEDLKTQAFAQSSIAAKFLPMMRTMAESGVYMLTPFILALAMTPAMFATIRMASMSYAWLLFWAPAYAMVNYLVYAYGNGQVQSLVTAGTGVTLASYTDYYDFLSQMNSFASTIIWGVPSIAAVAMYGMGSAASALMGGAQTAQHAGHHEANAFAHGRGEHVDSGRHLAWQDQMSSDGMHVETVRYVGGEGGILGESQTGMRTVYFSDGGHTTTGRDGMTTYSGPRGSYSQDGDGNYVAGVWRQEMQGPDGQMHEAQLQVSGDHVDVQYMKSDAHGIQHDMHMEMNQMANEPKVVTDSYSEGGLTKQITTMNDGSQRMSQVGTSMVSASRDGLEVTEPMDVTGTFYRASQNDPWEGVVTAHSSKHGEFHYSLSDVQSDDLGAPDLTKSMTVTSGSGSDQFRLHNNWEGLTVTDTSGPNGESWAQVHGAGKDVVLRNQDGTETPLQGMTIDGVGTKARDGELRDVNASVTGPANGMDVSAKGRLYTDPDTGKRVLEVSDQQWQSRLGGHSSGTVMRVGQQDGQGGYELNGGDVKYDGDPNKVGTPWHYHGQIKDLTSEQTFNGEMHFDGQQLVMSDMAGGNTQRVIGNDGSYTLYKGNLQSEDGGTYERFATLPRAAVPYVNSDGEQVYATGQATQHETGRAKYGADGSIEHDSAVTTASLVAPGVGRFDFTVGSSEERAGESLPIQGTVQVGAPIIEGQEVPRESGPLTHESEGPGQFTVMTPVEGSLRATMEKHEIHQGEDGRVVSQETADPRTGAHVASQARSGATYTGPKSDGARSGWGTTNSARPGGPSVGAGSFSNTDTSSVTRPIKLGKGITGVEHVDRLHQAGHPEIGLDDSRNVHRAQVESPTGGVVNRVDSSSPDRHTLSGDITEGVKKRSTNDVWEKDEVVMAEIDGLEGMYKIHRRSTYDLGTGKLVSSSYENTQDGHLILSQQMPDGSWQAGVADRVSDGEHTVTRFRAIDEKTYVGHGGYVTNEQGAPGELPAHSSGIKGTNFKTQDNLTSEHHGDSSYDKFGVVREVYNLAFPDDQIGPGNDKDFRKFADLWAAGGVAVETGAQAADLAWKFRRFKKITRGGGSGNPGINPSSSAPSGGGGSMVGQESSSQMHDTLKSMNDYLKKLVPGAEEDAPKILDQFGRPYKP